MSEVTSAMPSAATARRARSAAAVFNIGNIIAVLVPVPLGMLWIVMSLIVYVSNRHHPNEKVGHYTQRAAFRFYVITIIAVAAAALMPGKDWTYFVIAWAAAGFVLVPWSIYDLIKISKDNWIDTPLSEQTHEPISN